MKREGRQIMLLGDWTLNGDQVRRKINVVKQTKDHQICLNTLCFEMDGARESLCMGQLKVFFVIYVERPI